MVVKNVGALFKGKNGDAMTITFYHSGGKKCLFFMIIIIIICLNYSIEWKVYT